MREAHKTPGGQMLLFWLSCRGWCMKLHGLQYAPPICCPCGTGNMFPCADAAVCNCSLPGLGYR